MKRIIYLMCIVAAAISCTKQEVSESGGMGMLSVGIDLPQQTRALSQEQLYNTAKVNIYKADYSGLVRSYSYSDIPSPMYLPVDSYRVDVIAGEAVSASPDLASWENRSYKGSQTFDIAAGQTTSVTVDAGVSNAVTRVSFDSTVAANFNAGYTLTIVLDTGDSSEQLVYDSSKSGSEGYFIVDGLFEPSLSWTFAGTLAKDGTTFTRSGVIKDVLPGKLYNMNLVYTVKEGDIVFTLTVDRTTGIVDDTIVFEPISTGLSASSIFEIWATRATLHADVDASDAEGSIVQFGYSADGGSTWSYVDGVNDAEGTFMAELSGLAPATEYMYTLVIDGEVIGDPLSFTTEAAPNLPNASFEYVSLVSGKSYYKFYDPGCGIDEGKYMFWGSGNGEGSEGVNGSANMGIVITTIDTSDKIDGNQSVVAQTSSMIGILAAGNLFTGQFAGLVGTEGGMVNFGRPWTSRPSAMRIWCKYTTGTINILKNENLGVTKDDYDRAQIKVALGTWSYRTYGGTPDCPIHINTTDESTFVDFYTDSNTIANGDLVIYNDGYSINQGGKVAASTTGWIEYVIPLEYRDFNSHPTHIIVSCASSQFGDYFTGYDGARLWIDAIELIYE